MANQVNVKSVITIIIISLLIGVFINNRLEARKAARIAAERLADEERHRQNADDFMRRFKTDIV